MKRIRKYVAVAAVATSLLAGSGVALAQAWGAGGYPYGRDSGFSGYREAIEKMSPEDKTKLVAMHDKMMQSEMDYKMQVVKLQAQHEMDMERMHRDMEMWIINARMGH